MTRPQAGLFALSLFFALGALIAGLSSVALLVPGSPLESMWRLNPHAHDALASIGVWAIALMFVVALACGLAARGLWIRAIWGQRLAIGLLVVNLLGDLANAVVRSDTRTLIGLPIAIALIVYLLSPGVRQELQVAKAAG